MRSLAIVLLIVLSVVPGWCQTSAEKYRRDVDSLQAAIERYYPPELYNRDAWRAACDTARARLTEMPNLMRTLGDNWWSVPDSSSNRRTGQRESDTVITFQRRGQSAAVVYITGFETGESLISNFDRILDSLKDTQGLLLNFGRTRGGSLETAVLLASRFDSLSGPGFTVRTHIAGTDQHSDKLLAIDPKAPRRYEGAVVVNTPDTTTWPLRAFTTLLQGRPRTVVTNYSWNLSWSRGGYSGLDPVIVTLPGGDRIGIPTSVAMKANGEVLWDPRTARSGGGAKVEWDRGPEILAWGELMHQITGRDREEFMQVRGGRNSQK
jgi:hypothetical protein